MVDDMGSMTRRPWTALSRVIAVTLGVSLAFFGGPGIAAPQPARAISILFSVNTTSDAVFPVDMGCSLRAAITAANSGGASGYCGSGTAGPDDIEFSLAAGSVITVATPLPAITQTIGIDGTIGSGGRVRITGPGSGSGLVVSGAGSIVRDVVIDGFQHGIELQATGSRVFGSVIGPNSLFGIYAPGGGTIGGPAGTTPGGACTGDCNVITRNSSMGLYLANSGTVQGNHIGINAAGTAAAPNSEGIQIAGGTWYIGGTAAGAGNVISGNAGASGLFANGCSCSFQGNRIGTNSAGTAAVPNGIGIYVQGSGSVIIGGSAAGAGNIVSGNRGNGIELHTLNAPIIEGNRIGVSATGGALGNGGEGILLSAQSNGVDNAKIGSATVPAAANHIANNGGSGVFLPETGTGNQVRGNSIHDNSGPGIVVGVGGNEGVAAPVIGNFGPVRGTACVGCEVDIYSDWAGEGRIFEGSASVAPDGSWTFGGFVTGLNITATATTANGSTSAFSAPFGVYSPFTDSGTSLFSQEIYWLYANGITTGCTETTYCPKGTVTREQMASFLVRMFRLPSTATDYFTDDNGNMHEGNINRLAAAAITTGCTSTTLFCPKDPVTRAQMASFIVRAAGFTTGGARNYFGDDNGNMHEPNINRAAAAGVASGCGSYVYCPSGTVTREQMAAFLYRIVHPVNQPPYPAP